MKISPDFFVCKKYLKTKIIENSPKYKFPGLGTLQKVAPRRELSSGASFILTLWNRTIYRWKTDPRKSSGRQLFSETTV